VPLREIRWAPFIWLTEAAELNPAAPVWACSVWATALIGPGRVLGPIIEEQGQHNRLAWQLEDWRVAWHLCEQLAAGRVNAMPNPALARRADWRSPETAWSALYGPGDPMTGNGLLAALWELLGDARDPSARIVKNELRGEHPCTRLAGVLLGPAAKVRALPADRANVDPRLHEYGPASVMVRAAERLRGQPLPVDKSVLDELTVEQKRALAGLVSP
jgi:hypothetical protein